MRAGLVLGVLLAILAWAEAALAKRHALVIGNAAYREQPLANPVNDATDMAAKLRGLGFDVLLVTDATRRRMAGAFGQFAGRLRQGDEVLLFYAGHGAQLGGRNYLIPVDAEAQTEQALEFASVEVDRLLRGLEASGSRATLVILDACRNNPFERRFRGRSGGLAATDAARGTFIAYATAPGAVAADGDGRNSPFTAALVAELDAPGVKVEDMFKRVAVRVEELTRGRQTPWSNSSLRGDLILNLTVTVVPPPVAVQPGFDPRAVELAFWQSAERQDSAAGYAAYLAQYPQGAFAALARERVRALKAPQAAVPPPSLPPAMAEPVLVPVERAYAVTAAKANLREAPSLSAKVVGSLSAGEEVHVLARVKDQDWLLLERGGKRLGYMAASLLEEAEARKLRLAEEEARRKVAAAPPSTPPAAPATRPTPAVGLPSAGEHFRDCAECPELVWLPPGRFTMGSPASEEGRDDDEGLQREVRIGYPLAVGVYEVTRGQYAAFVRATGRSEGGSCFTYEDGKLEDRSGRGWRNPGFSQDDRHPVVCVNWDEAVAYAAWLSGQTGERYRLLSEAEWEYAARAGTTSARWWGSSGNAACGNANVHDRTSKARNNFAWQHHECDDGFAQTAPVGSFNANGFGLRDMLGNVWEWVGDCWNDNYVGAPSDGSVHTSGDCGRRVLRGGSWDDGPRFVRAANRYRYVSGLRYSYAGFRVARTY